MKILQGINPNRSCDFWIMAHFEDEELAEKALNARKGVQRLKYK